MFARYYKKVEKDVARALGGYAVRELDKMGVDVILPDGSFVQVKYGKKLRPADLRRYLDAGITVAFVIKNKKIMYILRPFKVANLKEYPKLTELHGEYIEGVYRTPAKSFPFYIESRKLE